MSLTYLLSTHPEPVLKDERSIIVLSLLESLGASTADELAHHIAGDRVDIASRLMALYHDRLIDVKAGVLQVSSRGKALLDRFDIGQEIVTDLLGRDANWSVSTLHGLLGEYREDAYTSYLKSLRTQYVLRCWSYATLESKALGPAGDPAPRLAFLLRDVEDWAATTSPSMRSDTNRELSSLYSAASQVTAEDSPILAALMLLMVIRPGSRAATVIQGHPTIMRSKHDVSLLCRFNEVQQNYSDTAWLGASCEMWTQLGPGGSTDVLSLLEQFLASPDQERTSLAEAAVTSPAHALPAGSDRDALAVLLVTEDLHAFARALGLTEGAAIALLERIEERVVELLASGEDVVGGN